MQLLAIPDYQGDNNSYSIAQIAQIQGVTLPSSLAYMVAIREITAGTTNTRLGGPAVSATNGLPLTTADSLILPNNSGTLPIPMRAREARSALAAPKGATSIIVIYLQILGPEAPTARVALGRLAKRRGIFRLAAQPQVRFCGNISLPPRDCWG